MTKLFGDSGKGNPFPEHRGCNVVPEHPGACKATDSFNTCGGYNSPDDVPGCVQLGIRRMDREEK